MLDSPRRNAPVGARRCGCGVSGIGPTWCPATRTEQDIPSGAGCPCIMPTTGTRVCTAADRKYGDAYGQKNTREQTGSAYG